MSRVVFPRRSSRCKLSRWASGQLLLALSFHSCAVLCSPARAQAPDSAQTTPALKAPTVKDRYKTSLPAKNGKPLSPELKARVIETLALFKQESACKTLVDLKVEGANLEEVVRHVRENLFDQDMPVEVRGAAPAKDSFDVKQTRAGDVLQHMAGLAGCNLYLLPAGLLIAPSSRLTEAERKSIKQRNGGLYTEDTNVSGNGKWMPSEQPLVEAIAQEVTGSDASPQPPVAVYILFKDFSPFGQEILAKFATEYRESLAADAPWAAPFYLDDKCLIGLETTKPTQINVELADLQRHLGMKSCISIYPKTNKGLPIL